MKGNKMTNVLEDMKAVYNETVWYVGKVDLVNGSCYLYYGKVFNYPSLSDLKPLLKFPDKDSEGNDCWSGDLIQFETGYIFFIWFNGFKWLCNSYEQDKSLILCESDLSYLEVLRDCGGKRLCSIYDKEALDHLPEDVVSKLKEELK